MQTRLEEERPLFDLPLGVYDISMKNYRKPIYPHFWNYQQLINNKKFNFYIIEKLLILENAHARHMDRGVRYIDEKLSKADKSVFLKLLATYRYRKMKILKLSKNYRYRKMHQIWSDKYMKSQSIRNKISADFYKKNAWKITPSCLVTLKRSTDSILIFLHRQLRY